MKTKNKGLIVAVFVVGMLMISIITTHLAKSQDFSTIEMNVEALAETEGPKCTGPKEYNMYKDEYYCKCENYCNCADLVGCFSF